MPRPSRTQHSCGERALFSMANVIHLTLLLLYCDGMNTETTPSPQSVPLITTQKAVSKGQNQVIIEELAILTPQYIELLCNLIDIPNNPPYITGYWTKDGQEIENSEETVNRNNEQYILKRTFSIQARDLGNYSCIFRENEAQVTFVLVVPVIKDKRYKPVVSYTGDSVVLECKLKHTPNTWNWYKANNTEKGLINVTANPLNYKIFINGNETKLTVLNLTEEDSGKYICSAEFDIKPSESYVELKVLSYTEPLKPFIAIVVEVIVLVTLILLWEKCNKPQHDNSFAGENDVCSEQTSKLTRDESNGVENNTARQRKLEH
ncbi:embigin-like [Sinocyclocheilus rhinocerous]|uniref:embigin-like n=1 Tax=Sinocyclocheilus rhinocerous TaxID=307959 RepID=UPI0007B84437|nr:PREDICTED: embigin-like [Sinocyclocheilus rhinocerous]XP_016428792.1 PREDICTED: embigin-like [Sinocyclocheilus rhinocerous]